MKNLLFLFLLLACNRNHLKISVVPSHFYESNKELINKAIILVQKHCKSPNQVNLNLKFEYLPPELLGLNPNQIGMTSFFREVTYIETNIYKYAYFNKKEQYIYLLHEIGHAIGLEHSEDPGSVMFKDNNQNADLSRFLKEIESHCKELVDVPREPKFN